MAISKSTFVGFTVLVLVICFDGSKAADTITPLCPVGWESFRDEHCYKLFPVAESGLHSYDEAQQMCAQEGATLLSVHSAAQQEFIQNYLFVKSKQVDGAWLGGRFQLAGYRWLDGSAWEYTNWAAGSPKSLADYCVQMHSEVATLGKWIDEPCTKKNLVVCQKSQVWSIVRMQEIVQEIRVSYLTRLQVLERQTNSIPIGFVYVQLPSEKSPSEIWPSMAWSDVSATYAGLFFRAVGGTSAQFGQIQPDAAPHLTGVERQGCGTESVKTVRGGWSAPVLTSRPSAGTYCDSLRFEISADEVRPKNVAIRIWKRTA